MKNHDDALESPAASAAQKDSLIQHFSIEGLYGYRTVSFSSRHAATILIAKNGSGKTTLLGALDAFLKGQFIRLSELDFERIVCRLNGVSEDIVLKKSDLSSHFELIKSDELWAMAQSIEVEPGALYEFLENDFQYASREIWRETPIFEALLAKYSFSTQAAKQACDSVLLALEGKSPIITKIKSVIKKCLLDYEVVYLPTYRRVELSLPEKPKQGRRRQTIQDKLGLPRSGLHSGEIQFGLSDISERLASLNQEMMFDSNMGYGEISANIIHDLLTGTFDRLGATTSERPSEERLKLFFSRVEDGRKYGPYFRGPYGISQIPDISKIYSEEELSETSRRFLDYFLGKLNSVMKKTQDTESVVEEFIKNCNRYLSGDDRSTSLDEESSGTIPNDDSKELVFNRRTLRVNVLSKLSQRRIPLDALSSGEKQMISLFGRLYLYPKKKKIVLIDEPELSLSIGWQRRILVDILTAPSCQQLIAITHSPFVFDNELDPYAKPIRLKFKEVSEQIPGNESAEGDWS